MKSRTKKYVDKEHQIDMANRRQRQNERVPVFWGVGSSKYRPNNLPNYRKSQRAEAKANG